MVIGISLRSAKRVLLVVNATDILHTIPPLLSTLWAQLALLNKLIAGCAAIAAGTAD